MEGRIPCKGRIPRVRRVFQKGRVLQEGRAPCDVRVLLHPAARGLQPRVPGRAKIPLCEVQC